MPPVWRCVSRQPHLAAFEKEASKCPPARVSQGSSDDVSCREMARFSKSREEHHAWSGRYVTEAHDSPAQDGEDRARARGLVVRGEPHDRVGGALPVVGQQQRQGPPRPDVECRAAGAARGDRRRACRAVGEETPWDTVSLRHPAPRSPFVRRVLGVHRGIGGGAVTSGGEGVGPSFVPCRTGGVRLRLSRELSHKSTSDRVFETLGIGLFKLERHP